MLHYLNTKIVEQVTYVVRDEVDVLLGHPCISSRCCDYTTPFPGSDQRTTRTAQLNVDGPFGKLVVKLR